MRPVEGHPATEITGRVTHSCLHEEVAYCGVLGEFLTHAKTHLLSHVIAHLRLKLVLSRETYHLSGYVRLETLPVLVRIGLAFMLHI